MLRSPFLVHPLFQRTVRPEEGMGEEEGEHADEERGHEDEGIVQNGIFFPVALLGMGIEFGEARCRSRVACSRRWPRCSSDESFEFGIGRRQDAMRAVAVGAFGDVRIAQPRHFAVVGLVVGVHLLGMAVPAALDERQLPLCLIGPRDAVLLMAVEAGGNAGVLVVPGTPCRGCSSCSLRRAAGGTANRAAAPSVCSCCDRSSALR